MVQKLTPGRGGRRPGGPVAARERMKKSLHLEDLPYCPDSCELFERLRDLPFPAFLDSAHPHAAGGRYDILSALPAELSLPSLDRGTSEAHARALFREWDALHRDYFQDIQGAYPDLPFCGGLLGQLGYGCGMALQGITPDTGQQPLADLRVYDWCVVQDHLLQRAVLVCQPGVSAATRADLQRRLRLPVRDRGKPFRLASAFAAGIDPDEYRAAFERIQDYIHAGDCYQVNLAQRFSSRFEGDPWHAYRALRAVAAAPFSAYLEDEHGTAVLSLSPERFLSLHGHHVETSPIKGTRPRYSDAAADRRAAQELRASAKDRAENLMIVDLLRNDLGRNCKPGSIYVDRLFEVQSFPTVHHLVSTISGELDAGRSAFDLLRDSFPGGSITGAPKRRAMQIIRELERHPREVYCGSVLYVSADGRMDSNIAIRTLLASGGELHCWGGGGIVADSEWRNEYQETHDKVGKLLAALEEL